MSSRKRTRKPGVHGENLRRLPRALAGAAIVLLTAGALVAEEKKAKVESMASITSKRLSGVEAPAAGNDGDPDLPLIGKKVEKGAYLQARSEYVAAARGLDTAQAGSRESAIRAMETRQRLLGISPFPVPGGPKVLNPTTWTFVGPSPLPNGQTSTVSTAVSGRVSAIAVDPTDANVVWAGAAGGGVYRSTDGGTNWTPILDSAQTMAIGAIAIAPSDPSIVYVGTGESALSADSFAGVGVYRITAAKSASPVIAGPFNQDGAAADIMTGLSISRIVVHETDPATIFVATTSGTAGNPSSTTGRVLPGRGLNRCTNATGASPVFTKFSPASAVPDSNITDVVAEPGNPGTLVLWVYGAASANNGGVYRTTNALAATPTFTQTLVSPLANIRGELAVNKVGAAVTVVLASGESAPATSPCTAAVSGGGGVRVSTDGGATWPATPSTGGRGFCSGQCFYDIYVAIHPTDATKILLGGAADSSLSNPCRASIHQTSTDGGATFTRKSDGLHADSHAAVYAPSNPSVVYVGNDGGIFKSTDGGNTWASLNNVFFSATQYQSIAVHPRDPKFTIGGAQDNGTSGMNAAGVWNRIDYGDGGYALIDQGAYDTTNVTMYHTYYNQANNLIGFARVTSASGATDGNWAFFGYGGTPNGIVNQNVLFYAPMALGPGTPNTVYFAGDRLYRSVNQGTTMTQVSQQWAGYVVTAIGVSPQDDNYRAVGTNQLKVWVTTTGANPMTDLSPTVAPLFPARRPYRVVFDPNDKNVLWATFGGFGVTAGQHVWKNTNVAGGAANWVPMGTGIPDVPVDAFVIDPQNSSRLYAGTDIGVYASTDGGASWAPFGGGLPHVAVFDMAIQNQSRTLRIATHGRGMWEIQIPGVPTGVVTLDLTSSTALPTSGNGNATFEPGEAGSLSTTLGNAGTATATAVSAVLSTATPGVTIVNGTSAYPNIAAAGSAANSTLFTFNLGPSFLCGQPIVFTLTVSYAGDPSSPRSFTIQVPTGVPGPTSTTASYTGPAVAIPDSNATGASASQTVSGVVGAISSVKFRIDGSACNTTPASTTVGLDHTWVGDLTLSITSPSGTTVVLSAGGGAAGVNFCQTVFDDAAATSWASVTAAQNPFSGSYRPSEALSKFAGEDPNGTWTFKAVDGGAGDTGSIRAFSIIVTPAVCAPVPAADLYTTPNAMALNVAAPGVLGNDAPNGATLTSYGKTTGLEQATIGSATPTAMSGSVTVQANGSFVYTAPAAFVPLGGVDSFKYALSDAAGSATGTVSVTVNPAPPTAGAHGFTVPAGPSGTIAAPGVLTAAVLNGGALSSYGAATGLEQTSIGSVTPTAQGGSVTVAANGSFTYVPAPSLVPGGGTDSFRYTVTNAGGSATGAIQITVLAGIGNSIPALSGWSLALFGVLLGLGGWFVLRR